MFESYRDVLRRPGAMTFSAAGLVARLPISMVTLAIVLLVEDRSGSYGLAGSVSAAYMVATAVSAPVVARTIDRWGQRRVLVPCFAAFAASLGGMVLAVERDWPVPLPHLLAALAGVSYPPIGACVRSRWTHLLGQGPALHTAFSVEAVVDETIFIVGPVLVTVLATQVHPMAGVGSVALCALVGGWWFTSLRRSEPPVDAARDAAARSAAGLALAAADGRCLHLSGCALRFDRGGHGGVRRRAGPGRGHRAAAGCVRPRQSDRRCGDRAC
ncbi:MAG: MFS transporter [Nocardioidaceae bacterium]